MFRHLLLAASLAITLGNTAHAAAIFTPPLVAGSYWTAPRPPHPVFGGGDPRQVSDGHFACTGTNVSDRARDVTVALIGSDGANQFERTCEALPPGATCWYETEGTEAGTEPHYCRIDVAGSRDDVRGSIELDRRGGRVQGRTALRAW